jgi:hypothetical protein
MRAGQLKHTAASLSLNTAAAVKALSDYWELRNLNPSRRVLFNYITTGDTANEENATFTGDRAGLDVWQSAKTNNADAEEIRAFLKGKSALLATLIKRLESEGTAYLGLKADFIPAETDSLEVLVQGLEGRNLAEAVKAEAEKHPFVVVVDQLDAICNLTDKKTRRLALILNFLRELARVDNVHIVASCRPFEFKFDQRLQSLNGTAVFGSHASQTLLDELASQLVNLPSALFPAAQRLYPRTDKHRQRGVLRRERARLLAVFPPSRLSKSGQAALAQDTADFGPPRTQRRPGPMMSFVGAPVRADEFAGKSEEEVFAVLDKYPDDYDRSQVPASSQEEISRSGGSDQQSAAFAGFAITNIEMGRLMMKRFKPGRHEKYAAALLSHWASPKQDGSRPLPPVVTYAELEQMTLDFAASGFKSDHFRGYAARVLQGIAKNNKGLRLETIELLQQWIPEVMFPEPDDYDPSLRSMQESVVSRPDCGGARRSPWNRLPAGDHLRGRGFHSG